MANNRLYIEDTKTGERLLLAKSSGAFWGLWASEEELAAWLGGNESGPRDQSALDVGGKTALRLVTEYQDDPPRATPSPNTD